MHDVKAWVRLFRSPFEKFRETSFDDVPVIVSVEGVSGTEGNGFFVGGESFPDLLGTVEQAFKHREGPQFAHQTCKRRRPAAFGKNVFRLIRRQAIEPSQLFVNL